MLHRDTTCCVCGDVGPGPIPTLCLTEQPDDFMACRVEWPALTTTPFLRPEQFCCATSGGTASVVPDYEWIPLDAAWPAAGGLAWCGWGAQGEANVRCYIPELLDPDAWVAAYDMLRIVEVQVFNPTDSEATYTTGDVQITAELQQTEEPGGVGLLDIIGWQATIKTGVDIKKDDGSVPAGITKWVVTDSADIVGDYVLPLVDNSLGINTTCNDATGTTATVKLRAI